MNKRTAPKKQIRQLEENLYCLEDSCNVYVIRQGDRCILIDFGTGEILDYLPKLGITVVEAVLLTHHHRDQAEGLPQANRLGIPVFVPETEKDLFLDANELWQKREILNNYNCRQDRFSVLQSIVAEVLLDYEYKEFLNMQFQIIPTPGHTTGSISILVELEGKKIAFTGDLIYSAGKVWSLAATQWSYNGGEGIAYSILSLLDLKDRRIEHLFPSHGKPMLAKEAIDATVENLAELRQIRQQNPRLFLLRKEPYEEITEHVLMNRTSMANSYVLLSKSKKALIFDFGYDFMAGVASGTDRSSRKPWLYTVPTLFRDYGVQTIDACMPTHYHDDHVAGMNLLQRVYGTKLLCAENQTQILEAPWRYDLPCLWYDPIKIDKSLSVEQPFQWEEYEIRIYPLSGHTTFAVAIEFEADGTRFLLCGDQYAGEEVDLPNYVYKNIFNYEDFKKSANLFRNLKPDWILSGHWQKKSPDEKYYRKLEQVGEAIQKLHEKLLPEEGKQNPANDFHMIFRPYQKTVKSGEIFELELHGLTPELEPELILPENFLLLAEEQKEANKWRYILQASQKPICRARIGGWSKNKSRNLGTQAEALITVKG